MSERICLWAAIGTAGLTLSLASCVPPPSQPPVATPPPARPVPPPPPPPPPALWEEAPLTPGTWSLTRGTAGSTAVFGSASAGSPVSIRCEAASRRIVIARAGVGAGGAGAPSLVVRTTFGAVAWPAVAVPGDQPRMEAARDANDPVFDQIAFSRGRFAIEGGGLPRVIMPAWAEVARVIEDCRG